MKYSVSLNCLHCFIFLLDEENQDDDNDEEDNNNNNNNSVNVQHELEHYAEELVKPHLDVQEASSAMDYFKAIEFYNILNQGETKTKSEIVDEMEDRWANLDKKKKKEFEELEKLAKQKEKIEKDIKDKFLKLKRNLTQKEDEEGDDEPQRSKSKSNKKLKK